MTATQKVLIITYYWPPSGGAGVQRWLKMVKYLPQSGILPVVLTVDPDYVEYPVLDESLCREVDSSLQVYHTPCKNYYAWYKKYTGTKQSPYGGFANEGNPSFKQKVARFIRGNFFLPDARRGWNEYAYRKALDLLRKEGIQTVITTGPPMSTHLIGKRLKKQCSIRWVADFRDPWTDLYYKKLLYPTWIARRIDASMERSVLFAADHILAATPEVGQLLQFKSNQLPAEKFTVITNGFDPSDVEGETKKSSVFTLIYTGTLSTIYPIQALLESLQEVKATCDIRFRLVGKIDEMWAAKIRQMLGDSCEMWPYVPHRQSIEEVKKASLSLLVLPQAEGYQGALPGKLFEYMGTGVPVLCLCDAQSDAKRLIEDADAGQGFEYGDKDGITAFLLKQYRLFTEGVVPARSHKVENYRRDRIAAQVATLLQSFQVHKG